LTLLGSKPKSPQSSSSSSYSTGTSQTSTIENLHYIFCGLQGHFISDRLVCQSYITDGKCKKNSDRKIVLPNGQFTPHSIPGRYIKEHIDEWHKRNPSTSTSSSLMYEISPISMPAQADVKATNMISTPSTNVLMVEQRIAALEQEIFAL
jgi:hypothetical protein